MSRFIRLLVVAFALIALLGAPLASEAAPRRDGGWAGASFDWLWRALSRVWEKEGCFIDPFGRCIPGGQGTTEAGCRIDPDGLCVPKAPVNTKNGCYIDPFGRCLPPAPATTDNGCSIDPFGRCTSGN